MDIDKLESQLQSASQKLLDLGELGSSYQLKLQDEQVVLGESETELNRYKESFDTELYKEYMAKVQQKVDLDNTLATLKVTIKNKLEKLEKLQQHEYDPNCKYCCDNVFVKDAIDTKQQLESDKETVHEFLGKLKEVSNFIEINSSIADQAEEIQKLVKQYGEAKASVDKYQSAYDKVKHEIATVKHNISNLQRDIQTYNANTQTLENNKKIQVEIKEVQTKVSTKKIELSKLNNVVKDFHGRIRVAETTIAECNKSIKHMQELVDKQVAYDLYCKAMCKDGIPYVLISKAVPYIQHYVNNILSQVIDFTVEMETDGKNINVFICYDDNKWPLELSSGMERFISSLAIRIALIKITNLPKPDFIAIDEGLGVLDSSNLNSMHTLFTYMKDIFRFSLVISHIDVVRDMVDNIITIDRKDDLSHINC